MTTKKIFIIMIASLLVGSMLLLIGIFFRTQSTKTTQKENNINTAPRVTPVQADNAATTVYIDTKARDVKVGDEITFTVAMDAQNNVTGATIIFSFNPQIIEITSVSAGTFLPNVLESTINPQGTIDLSIGTFKPVPGRGTLAIITAKALSATTTTNPILHIEPESVVLELKNNQSVLKTTSDAYVTIK